MSKLVYQLIGGFVLLGLIIGCAPQPTQAPQPPAVTEAPATEAPQPPAATEAPAPTEAPDAAYEPIVVACWSGPEHENLVKVAAEYEKKTGNKVIVEEIAREAYYDKLTTTFVGGGSDYDVAYVSSDWIPSWVEAGALKDLTSFIEDPKVAMPGLDLAVFGKTLEYFTFDGKLYVFPSEGDTAWLWYRKDLFEAKGLKVPETWDEYLEAALALNNPPEIYGTVIGAKRDEVWWDFMYYLFGMGGDLLDENYNPIINNEIGVQALTFYSDLLLKHKVVSPDVVNYGYNEILTALQEGKAAMGIQWMAATQTLTDCNQSPKVCKDGQPLLGYTLVPGVRQADGTLVRKTGGSQWGWAIPSGSKNQEAAYKFIEWLTSKEGATMWALNGGIPSNIEALTDPKVVEAVPQFALLAEVMPYRALFPVLTVSPEMLTVVQDGVVAVVSGVKDPKSAADEMAAKLAEILKSGGYLK
ncbi:MAG: sugar ABC transporter substrate-binding protein [Anaerolineales bacterium]|nr:sugar ABC transporter substrate-binding protein [Anaerolineales bacterium]MDW8447279.1 sugar ABC transporter substrate-binding protein [Anaerolineales bacterium]